MWSTMSPTASSAASEQYIMHLQGAPLHSQPK